MLRNLDSSKPLILLIAWTLFVWVSRTRNVLGNSELDGWGTTWRLGVVVVFVLLGVSGLIGLFGERVWLVGLVSVLVWWTVGYWLVRGIGILLDDYETSFVVVHTILMLISIGLAMWVWARRSR